MTHNEIELPLSSGCPGSPVKKDAPNKAAGNSEKAPWHHPGMGSCFHLKSCAMNGIRHKMKFTIAIVFWWKNHTYSQSQPYIISATQPTL